MSLDDCETCIPFSPRSPLSVLSPEVITTKPEIVSEVKIKTVTATETPVVISEPVKTDDDTYKGYSLAGSATALIVWFIILFVVIAVCLYALKPTMVYKKKEKEIDNGKIILTALVLALLIVLFIWIIGACLARKQ